MRHPQQLELAMRTHGGARKGAGRKRRSSETVPHARRPVFNGEREPLHLTVRIARGVWNLRSQRGFRAVERALRAEKDRDTLRIAHYSVQGNHLHLIAEAHNRHVLGRRMQGFGIRLARAVNKMMGRRRGRVLAERYHLHVLRSGREVRNVIRYVNHVKHHGAEPTVDPYSSGPWFDGWSPRIAACEWSPCTGPPPIAEPDTWLLRHGWSRYGAII
jgi:REP element-mobilizing transposase RayT